MGVCCHKVDYQQNDSILTQGSFIQSKSIHDDRFVYFFRMFNLNHCINQIIKNPQQYYIKSLELENYQNQIQQYLRQIDNPDSQIGRRIKRIQKLILNNNTQKPLKYLILEIQKIQLNNVRNHNAKIQISMKGEESRSFQSNVFLRENRCEVDDIIVEWTFFEKQNLIIKIDKSLSCTINLNEIENNLVKMDYINLKKQQILEPLGKIFVRIQFIQNIQIWRSKFKQILNLKLKQIEILRQSIQEKKDLKNLDFLIISMCQNMQESKLKGSFYQNSYAI